jgi:type I restriction enzyme M protein
MPEVTTQDQAELEVLLNGTDGVTTKTLEPWLWEAACSIRGAMDAPKYRDYILPLVFLKRLSDVYDDEIAALAEEFEGEERARKMVEADHQLVRIFLPPECHWDSIRGLNEHVGERVTKSFRRLARENPALAGVVDVVDFNAAVNGQRIIDDQRLRKLIEVLSRYRLGLSDVEPDVLGRAYEYLLRKFAENQGLSAGEFFTPKEVGWLVAELIDPQPGESVHDPAAGSSGLLIKAELLRAHRHGAGSNPLELFAQERLPTTYALSRMNLFIHDLDGYVELGDTLVQPKFTSGSHLRQFDAVVANPMWNQSDYDAAFYEADTFKRFTFGEPPANTADLAWVQHIVASMTPSGRAAIVLDTNAVNRGSGASGKNKERDIRRKLVEEQDLVDGVILLPENLFYNTGAPGLVLVLRKDKPVERAGKVVLVNASQEYVKGQPKNILPLESVAAIAEAFHAAEDVDGFVRVMTVEELQEVDFDLSPNRHVVPPLRQREATMGEAKDSLEQAEGAHAAFADRRRVEAAAYAASDRERLNGTSKLGPIPGEWKLVPLGEAVIEQFSGDYGDGAPTEGHTLCRVVKATNFPEVEAGRLDGLVERFVRESAVARKRIREGDFIIETSGGGKHQATGRVLYVTQEIAEADPPVHPTNFTRVLRLDLERFVPRFVYHYWRLLYGLGRTQPYERQPTQIRNFKTANFLANEFIPELDPGEQARLVRVLDALESEQLALRRRADALAALHGTALFDVLTGQFVSADGG